LPQLLASLCCLILALALSRAAGATAGTGDLDGRQLRCLTLIGFAEAANDGDAGMAAVIRVVRNRMRSDSFPDDACAVVAQSRQFQPIEDSSVLKKVVQDPEGYDLADVLNARSKYARSVLGSARDLARNGSAGPDPTKGALYFVNPLFMDKDKCPWFAGLKRTAKIGGHVFMTEYAPGEARGDPALDCSIAGTGVVAGRSGRLARQYMIGLFDPQGPQTASRTATRAQLQAWKRTGQLAKRQAALKRQFTPGWYLPE
jgi:hypothetical protein